MKAQSLCKLLLAGVGLLLVDGCANYPQSGHDAMVGTWTNSLGTVWIIKADGTFDVDLTKHGKRDAWGTWQVAGDTVTLQRTGGINPKGCNGPGDYKFSRTDEDTLQFTLVKDKCKLRIKNVTLPWKRK